MPVPVQSSPFEPINFYDAPGVIAGQVIDGHFGFGNATKAFTSPMDLAPSEREGVAARLKAAAGGGSVTNALIGVATNPWAWFMFLAGPAGEKPVGDLFRMAAKYSPYIEKNAPLLATIGGLTNGQALRDTRSGRAVYQFEKGMREMKSLPEYVAYNDLREQIIKAHGLDWEKGFAYSKYSRGSPQELAALEISKAFDGAMTGTHLEGRVVKTPYWNSSTGKPDLHIETLARETPINGEDVLRKYGAEGLVPAARNVLKTVANKVFSDPKAVTRLFDGMARNVPDSQLAASDIAGRAMVRHMLGDLSEQITKGTIDEAGFHQLIKDAILDPIHSDQNYLPRNLVDTMLGGKRVDVNDYKDARWASAIRAGNSVTPRLNNPVINHPQDLADMRTVLGATPALEEKIAQSESIMADTLKDNRPVRFFRQDADSSIHRYVDGMARNYSMFVQDVGPGVREIDKNLAGTGTLKAWNTADAEAAMHRPSINGKRAGLDKTFSEIEGTDMEPRGGISIADVLYADHGTLSDPWRRQTLSQLIIPHMMGRISLKSVVATNAVIKAKESMGWMVESGVGKAIEGSGAWGQKFVGSMRKFSETTDTAFEEGQDLQRFILKGLYVSHLGLNVPSAIINMTQPFMFAGNWGGYGNMTKAYGSAFKEFGDYFSERASGGFAPISTRQRMELLTKTHKFANFGGEDLLQASGDALETMEGNLHKAFMNEGHTKGFMERAVFEYPMKLFSTGELLNKNVAAHTAFYRAQSMAAKGVETSGATLADNIRSLVQETQFGSHWMNTPQAMLKGADGMGFALQGVLSNPLLSQFLRFPWRSFTSWAYTSPRLAGREGKEALQGFVNDTLRGIGVSAIGYEIAKGLTGADISRAGFVSAVTDVIPGFSQGRMDFRDGPIPTPPIIDIPYKFMQGMFTDDMNLVKQALPRLIPGGVAISRAMGALPDEGGLGFVTGQRTFADWSHATSDGKVPIFKDDGTLIGMQNPTAVILSGLGADLGAFKGESQMTQYLVKQREEILNARRDYMARTVSGDSDGANSAAMQFEKRFKIPLTVTKGQWDSFMNQRQRPRVERVLDTLPQDARGDYIRMVQQSVPETLNTPVGTFADAESAKGRDPFREPTVTLSPQVMDAIRAEIQQSRPPNPRRATDVKEDDGLTLR